MNNKGLSLVEMVIVVSIIAVFTAIVSMGVGVVVTKPADECAEKLVSTINGARVSAMGKAGAELVVRQDAKGAVYVTVNGIETQIGKNGITVTCTKMKRDGTGKEVFALNSKEKIIISFNRSNGGFQPIKCVVSSGTEYADDIYLDELVISKGSRSKKLKLVPITGKVQIN